MSWLNHVTDWERASLWRRIPCAFGRVILCLLAVAVVLKVLYPPIMIFATDKLVAREYPDARIVPRPLENYTVSNAPATTVSYFGYEFDVPWRGKLETKAFTKNGIVDLEFRSGQYVLLIVSPDQRGMLSQMGGGSAARIQTVRMLYGDLVDRSAYDQYSAVLNTSPSTIALFWPRAAAVRGMELLMLKGLFSSNLGKGLFSFQLQGNRGFEIGDPTKSRRTELEIFTPSDHHVKIICERDRKGPVLAQSELNLIIKSLHEVSPPSLPTSANGNALTSPGHIR